MLQERDDVVALDSAIIQHPQDLGGERPPRRLHRPAGRLPHLQAPLPRRPARVRGQCGRKPSKHPGETPDCDLTEARDFNLMFETTRRAGQGRGLDRLPAPRDRAGDLPQLQELPPVLAQEAAVRDRADRQELPQRDHARATSSSARASSSRWRWSSSCRRRRPTSGSSTGSSERGELVHAARDPRPTTCGCAPTTPTSSRTTRARPATSSTCSRSAGGARGDRQPRRLRPHASTPSTRARSSSTSTPRPASATSRT